MTLKRNEHTITREIGIDMAHRVTYHGSKCKHLHGHRYTIQATCKGPLFETGEQEGMVVDFGFLKDIMMRHIDEPCDHGTTLWVDDPIFQNILDGFDADENEDFQNTIRAEGYVCLDDCCDTFGKLYIVPFVPTAENLAKHWFECLETFVASLTDNQARLVSVKVWETPNCSAEYTSEVI